MENNRWALFDLDGTLTQSEEGIWNCVRYAAKKMGVAEPEAETLRKFIGPPLRYSFHEYMGMTAEDAERAQTFYRERYITEGLFENRVYPGVRGMLRRLKMAGFHIGIVTGKPEEPTRRILAHFCLDKFLETVVCATDGHAEKEFLIRKALPEGAGETWMIGDRRFDMEGGKKAGVHTVGVTYGYGDEEELKASGAEALARKPEEIGEILCPETEKPRGAFLSIEGLDGSGKGTQIEALLETLARYGFETEYCREPGGTPIGEKIRTILLDRNNREMTDETEALLYAASRAQLVREVIRPAVKAGRVLVCDRFVDSSAAYQGGGRQMGVDRILAINEPAVDGTWPQLTLYLRIDHQTAMKRRLAAAEPDRMESEQESFHARVEAAYDELAKRMPERYVMVNADRDRQEIAAEIAEKVLKRLMEAEA